MSGLTPTILLIVTFLVVTLVLRMAGRHVGPMPPHESETDDHPGER